MKEDFTEVVLKKYILEIIELSREIQEESFDLCYFENMEVSDNAKLTNNNARNIGMLAGKIRNFLD